MRHWQKSNAGVGEDRKGSNRPSVILGIPSRPIPPGFGSSISIARRSAVTGLSRGGSSFYIQSGIVQLISLENSRQPVVLGFRSAGWIVGNVFGVAREALSLAAISLTVCEVRPFSRPDLNALSDAEVRAYFEHVGVMSSLAAQSTVSQQQSFRFHDPFRRVAAFLSDFTGANGMVLDDRVSTTVPLTQVEVAAYLWISPEHVNRLLHKLQLAGAITGGKWPHLELNLPALQAVTKGLVSKAEREKRTTRDVATFG